MATIAEMQADLAALRAARLSYLTTGVVKEIVRNGRKLVYGTVSLDAIDSAIADLVAMIEDAEADAIGTRVRRRSAIGLYLA